MRISQKQFRHFQKQHSQFRAHHRLSKTMKLPSGTVADFVMQNLDTVNYSAKARQHQQAVKQMVQRYCHRIDRDHVQIDAGFLTAIETVPNLHYYTRVRHRNGRIRDNRPENLKWVP